MASMSRCRAVISGLDPGPPPEALVLVPAQDGGEAGLGGDAGELAVGPPAGLQHHRRPLPAAGGPVLAQPSAAAASSGWARCIQAMPSRVGWLRKPFVRSSVALKGKRAIASSTRATAPESRRPGAAARSSASPPGSRRETGGGRARTGGAAADGEEQPGLVVELKDGVHPAQRPAVEVADVHHLAAGQQQRPQGDGRGGRRPGAPRSAPIPSSDRQATHRRPRPAAGPRQATQAPPARPAAPREPPGPPPEAAPPEHQDDAPAQQEGRRLPRPAPTRSPRRRWSGAAAAPRCPCSGAGRAPAAPAAAGSAAGAAPGPRRRQHHRDQQQQLRPPELDELPEAAALGAPPPGAAPRLRPPRAAGR